jgi:hypothetical protein
MKTKEIAKITNLKSTLAAILLSFAGFVTNGTESFTMPERLDWNAYLAIETEKALEVESWMKNDAYFYSMANLVVETEKPLKMESWMKNENLFSSLTYLAIETEKALEVESWMLDESIYNSERKNEKSEKIKDTKKPKSVLKTDPQKRYGTRTFFLMEVKDKELKIEEWMFDPRLWNSN